MPDADRLLKIETKLAYQEDLLQSLNDTIVQQEQRIAILEERYRGMVERLIARGMPAGDDGDGVPPHY